MNNTAGRSRRTKPKNAQPWRRPCRCGTLPKKETWMDEGGKMYTRYRCSKCGRRTVYHITCWEAQTQWEETHADTGG